MMNKKELEALCAESSNNKVTVHTLSEATSVIQSADKPTQVHFPSMSLGAEDKFMLNHLVEYGLSKQVIVIYDEADLIQTDELR